MAATKVQMNFANVSMGTTVLTRVNSVALAYGGALLAFAGDGDIVDSVLAVNAIHPTATVSTADVGTAMSLTPGTGGSGTSFIATFKDAMGATSGAVNFVLANAVVETVDTSGQHAAWAGANVHIKALATDGITNPLTFTRS